jgi:hypothetical protein
LIPLPKTEPVLEKPVLVMDLFAPVLNCAIQLCVISTMQTTEKNGIVTWDKKHAELKQNIISG